MWGMVIFKARDKWRPLVVGAVAVGLLLAGVGAGAAAGRTATASAVKEVDVVNFAFKPATLRIAKGDRVSFANTSRVTHTATRDGAFDTGLIKPGKSVVVRFKQKGSFPYLCLIHPSMRGKIVVN
jgi:plastocyanin